MLSLRTVKKKRHFFASLSRISNEENSDDKKNLASQVKMTQAIRATLEPNVDLARLNPNRGTWERIEGKNCLNQTEVVLSTKIIYYLS